MTDNRNLILAVILSVAVVFGWQYFVAGPKIDQTRQHTAQTSPAAQSTSGSPTATTGTEGAAATPGAPTTPGQATVMTRDQARNLDDMEVERETGGTFVLHTGS